jgi:hypothetical protein
VDTSPLHASNDVDDSYDGHDNVYDGCDDGVEYQLYYFFTYYRSVLLSD